MKEPGGPRKHTRERRTGRTGSKRAKRTGAVRPLASQAVRARSITHVECQQMLEWYAGDEQMGLDVQKLYPAVAAHLQACDICRKEYELYRFGLQDKSAPASGSIAPPLAFLSPAPRSPWFKASPSQLLGPRNSIGFWLNPTHLKSLFVPPADLRTRGDEMPGEQELVLDDDAALGEQPIHLQAWLVGAHSRHLGIRVETFSSAALPEPLLVHLDWEGQSYTQPLESGKALFENIPPPDFSRHTEDEPIPDFRLILDKA